MWVARIKINSEKGVFGSRTNKHNVSVTGYPVYVKRKGKFLHVDIIALLSGAEQNKKEFIKDLKKSKDVAHLEVNGDLIAAQVLDPEDLEPIYAADIINLEPILIDTDGNNFYTLGSWDKPGLNRFLHFLDKTYQIEILSLKKKRLSNFSFIGLMPGLTEKQKSAINLAIKEGYYHYPRKISVEKMAEISKVSFSAFHAHLRKAEQKLLSFSSKD